jgi:hypothetical protein
MKRRDFIKTIGISCMGSCFNPLGVLAAGTTPLKSHTGHKAAFPPLRLNPLSTSVPGITSLDDMTYAPGPLLEKYDEKKQARRELYLQLQIFGENEIDTILDEMRDSYETIIPDMPYIGEFNFHLRWFIPNSEKLAEYLALERYGVTKKEFSNLHLTQASKELLIYTEDERMEIGKSQFGFRTERMMAAWAFWSQFRVYPEDYILYFRKGDGVDFDWGFDYKQCANVLLYEKHGALDLLVPLVCTMDDLAGSALFTGYRRTMQLATRDPMCDLRWKLQV